MTRVKICALTRREDALRAAEAGADAVGFVFAPRSRRRVEPEQVARIVEELPPFVTTVGVFQDQAAAEVRAVVAGCGLDVAQLHGSENAAYVAALGLRVLKAIALGSRQDLEALGSYPRCHTFLLDTRAGSETGGTGRCFDWTWAREAKRRARIVLAGGLHPGNVAAAVQAVRPWAVDTASGVEASTGIKDPGKIKAFIAAAKNAIESDDEN